MEKITIRQGAYAAQILPYGATLHALFVPDRSGAVRDIVLGYDTLEEYRQNDGYLGATVGRYANRIAGACFTLNGEEWRLDANEGENLLHSGATGLHQKIWDYTQTAENAVTLRTVSPHGEGGFPGTLQVAVTYTLDGGALTIGYEAVSDRDTVVSLTNHAYFNLAGQGSGTIADHTLAVNASHYTPCGAGTIPTGEIRAVAGTALDLRQAARLGDRLGAAKLAEYSGYDHNFVLDNGGAAAVLYCGESGIEMAVDTTLPGLQVYSAGFLSQRQGKSGAMYAAHHGICLETQHFPDAMHHAAFPSPVLPAGAVYRHKTVYRFAIK